VGKYQVFAPPYSPLIFQRIFGKRFKGKAVNSPHPALKDFSKYLEPIPRDVQDHWVNSFGEKITHLLVGLARAQEMGAHMVGNKSTPEKRLAFLNKYLVDNYSRVGIPWSKQSQQQTIEENRQWVR
jgi:hypothetical protein